MILAAIAQLLAQAGGLDPVRITPSTEVNPLTQSLPRVAYTLTGNPQAYTDDGPLGLRAAKFQLDIFSASLTDGQTILGRLKRPANAEDPTKRGLDGYRGTVDATAVRWIGFEDEFFEAGALVPGQNQTIARCVVALKVYYRETP